MLKFVKDYSWNNFGKSSILYMTSLKFCSPLDFWKTTSNFIPDQWSGTYGSRARCGSFDDGISLAWYFLNTIFTNQTFCNFPSTRLQSHQKHHAAPEVALTARSILLKRKFRHFSLLKKLLVLL